MMEGWGFIGTILALFALVVWLGVAFGGRE